MNAEWTAEQERRAAKHAALADAARLRIVDLLTLSDYSPVELQLALGISSNLLAHHLNVLDRAGLIARTRSEADRRRNYVHLRPDALDGLQPGAAQTARRIVFVCTANSARSRLAAALWRGVSTVPAGSAGTDPAPAVAAGAVAVAARHGFEVDRSTPVRLDAVVQQGDLLVTVCDAAHERLQLRDGLHWSVPDPVPHGTDAAFDEAYEALAARIDDLAARIRSAA